MLKQKFTKGIAFAATVALLAGCAPAVDPTATGTAKPGDTTTTTTTTTTTPVVTATATPAAVVSATATPPATTTTTTTTTTPAVSAAPVVNSSTIPQNTTGTTSDIKEKATFNGKVFDTSGVPVDDATVTAKSVDPAVEWTGEPQKTQSGAYVFRNAPVGVRLEVTAKKDGWTTRLRTEVLKSNLTGDPKANVFDFGAGNGTNGTDPNNLYSIQDEPEVTMLKINGKIASDSDSASTGNASIPPVAGPNPRVPDTLTGANLTGISSDSLTVEMTFSEPVRRDDVQNYFRVLSTDKFDTRKTSFQIDANLSSVQFTWAADDSSVTVKTTKGILSNKGGDEAKYLLDFTQSFRDKTDKPSKARRTFRFSPSKINDFNVFSVKNQDADPFITGIQAIDGGSSNDTIRITYSKPMDVINQTVPQAILASGFAPNNGTLQLFAYNTPNAITENNATVVGYMTGTVGAAAAVITNQFRASYVIGRIKSADLRTNDLVLNPLNGNNTFPTSPAQYGGAASYLKSSKVDGNVITLEFNPQAFDKDDRVIVAAGRNIEGNFNDKANSVQAKGQSLKPTIGFPAGGDFTLITDPSGRNLDSGNSSTSANIDINNAQKVATAN